MDWHRPAHGAEGDALRNCPSRRRKLFPWTESFHVLSITIVVGVISIVDLRLMGVLAHKKDITGLLRQVLPLTWVAFVVAVVDGLPDVFDRSFRLLGQLAVPHQAAAFSPLPA